MRSTHPRPSVERRHGRSDAVAAIARGRPRLALLELFNPNPPATRPTVPPQCTRRTQSLAISLLETAVREVHHSAHPLPCACSKPPVGHPQLLPA